MNKARKKAIKKALELFYSEIDEARNKLEEVIESARDDEQDAYDNTPESLTCTERYYNMEECIDAMDEVISYLEDETGIGAYESLEALTDTLEIDLYE